MNYQFNISEIVKHTLLPKRLISKLIEDVKADFPDDPMMQDLHLRRYIDFEISKHSIKNKKKVSLLSKT